jgi:hypothetical protein
MLGDHSFSEEKFDVHAEDEPFTTDCKGDGGIADRRFVKIQQLAVDPE